MYLDITWLTNDYECEDCGCSSAYGALVTLDGDLLLHLEPSAHCFGGSSWDEEEVYRMVLEKLGYTISFSHDLV